MMNEDRKEAFVAAALETFNKLSECPDLKNYRVYCEPEKSPQRKSTSRVKHLRKSPSKAKNVSSLPFRWVLVVSAQKSAHEYTLKVQGYRKA
jgi:phosphopantetheine adenylyltransferase